MRIWLKILNDSIIISLRELWGNKLRTLLSLLGVTIGIFCVIAILSAVDSLKRNLEEGINKLGSDVVYVGRWPWEFGNRDYPWWKYIARPQMTYDDYRLLQTRLESADGVALICFINGKLVSSEGTDADNVTLSCPTHDYYKIQSLTFSSGRYFTEGESASGTAVCIIGSDVAETLFGSRSAEGRILNVLGRHVRVVGVFAREGSSITNNSTDNQVMMPFNFVKTVENIRYYDPQLIVKARAGVPLDMLDEEVHAVMRSIHMLPPGREDDFAVNRITMISNALEPLFGFMNIAGFVIGFFALLVGAFGIANIMFVSVRERINLIGIKKALGARRGIILLEFLVEAIMLCLLGGLVGLLLVDIAAITATHLFGFHFVLSVNNIILGLSIASITGILAGAIPAYVASRLDPVEAIRSK